MSKMDPPSYTSPPYLQPPPPQVPPQHPSQQQNVMTIVIVPTAFGKESQHLVCPHCHANIATRVESEPNSKTHMFALILCVCGLCCCAPCPYYIDSCLVQKHYCPECKNYLGESNN